MVFIIADEIEFGIPLFNNLDTFSNTDFHESWATVWSAMLSESSVTLFVTERQDCNNSESYGGVFPCGNPG
jgi:hypothetical protein